MLPLKTWDDPDMEVIEEERRPPVHDSAKPIDSPLFSNSLINMFFTKI